MIKLKFSSIDLTVYHFNYLIKRFGFLNSIRNTLCSMHFLVWSDQERIKENSIMPHAHSFCCKRLSSFWIFVFNKWVQTLVFSDLTWINCVSLKRQSWVHCLNLNHAILCVRNWMNNIWNQFIEDHQVCEEEHVTQI